MAILANFVVFCLFFIFTVSAGENLKCTGKRYTSKPTAYYPSNDPGEGGFVDCKDTKLQTLQDFLAGKANYVSVAMDKKLKIKYGTKICIPELNQKYKKNIEFRVVDTGPSFTNKGFGRIDICVADKKSSFDSAVNNKLTLYFKNLKTGKPSCN